MVLYQKGLFWRFLYIPSVRVFFWKEIQGEEEEEDKKRDAHAQFIKDREDKKLAIQVISG